MKNSSDSIGNRTRDLPTCTAVSRSIAPPRTPHTIRGIVLKHWDNINLIKFRFTGYHKFVQNKDLKFAIFFTTFVLFILPLQSYQTCYNIQLLYTANVEGFGGLVVSILATGTRVRGFKPGRSRWIFRVSGKSSVCLPSEGK